MQPRDARAGSEEPVGASAAQASRGAGAYGTRRVAVIVYGASLALTGLTLALIWGYATHGRRLVHSDLDPLAVRRGLSRILLGPALYGFSIVVCFVSVWISLAIYVLVPVLYILPGRIDRHWRRPIANE